MTKTKEDKKRLLEFLRDTPNISIAARKAGISRATLYRWFNMDSRFRERVEEALSEGREQVNDGVEAVLIKRAREGEMSAIRYWLRHNNPRYKEPPVQSQLPVPQEHRLSQEELAAIERVAKFGLLPPGTLRKNPSDNPPQSS